MDAVLAQLPELLELIFFGVVAGYCAGQLAAIRCLLETLVLYTRRLHVLNVQEIAAADLDRAERRSALAALRAASRAPIRPVSHRMADDDQ